MTTTEKARALVALRASMQSTEKAKRALRAATSERDRAVTRARDAGISVRAIGCELGLSGARISQIGQSRSTQTAPAGWAC